MINNTHKGLASRSMWTRMLCFLLCCVVLVSLVNSGDHAAVTSIVEAKSTEELEAEVEQIKGEVNQLEQEINNLENEAAELDQQVSDLENEQSSLDDELAQLEADRDATAADLEAQQAQSENLQQQIAVKSEQIAVNMQMIEALSQQITTKTTLIDKKTSMITEREATIANQEALIITLEQKHEDTYEALRNNLRNISQTNTSISWLQMLLGSESYSDFLIGFKLSERISGNSQRLMDTLDALAVRVADAKAQNEEDKRVLESERSQLEQERAELEQEQAQLEAIQAENETKQAELKALYDESAALEEEMASNLAYLESQIADIDSKQNELESAIAQALADAEARRKEQERLEQEQEELEQEQDRIETEIDNQEKEEQEIPAPDDSDDNTGGSNIGSQPPVGSGDINGLLSWPTPTCKIITSSYKYRPQFGRWHYGIDTACYGDATGQPIYAAADGEVIYSGWMSGYGECIMIDHGYKTDGTHILTLYGHCNRRYSSVGDKVIGGQTHIGDVGNTGVSFGAHLHFEVRENNSPVNPINYLSTADIMIFG